MVEEDKTNKYKIHYFAYPAGHVLAGQHGVAIAVSTVENEVAPNYEIIKGPNPARLMSFAGTVKGEPMTLTNVYGPTDTAAHAAESTEFYDDVLPTHLAKLQRTVPRHRRILGGDLNAIVGHEKSEHANDAWQDIRGYATQSNNDPADAAPSENGQRLLDFWPTGQPSIGTQPSRQP